MKRVLCLLLVCLMAFSAIALCACDNEDESSAASETVSKEEALVPHLEKKDWKGQVLHVLSSSEEGRSFDHSMFGMNPEETEAEPVAEAALNRDALLAEEYGFTIETELAKPWQPFIDRVNDDMMTNMVDYDVVISGIQTMATLTKEGYFLDLLTIENSNLHLNENWWDVASNEDMTIGGKLFFTTGDILVVDDESTRCVFYNKGLREDAQLDDPTKLVYDNTWTIDKMYEMCKGVAAEMDDGQMTVTGNDIWGMVSESFDLYSLILGCNCPQVEKDQNDLPVIAMTNERNVNAYLKAFNMISDESVAAYTERWYRWDAPEASLCKGQFFDNKALFYVSTINVVNSEKLREANIHYGILPMPMYDAAQEGYATTVDPYHFSVLSIMSTCRDTDFATYALEALAYTSKKLVTPQYYDVTLKTKRFLDDDDSPKMLDIIFSNRLVDISVAFNWADCIQFYNQALGARSAVLTSFLESKLPGMEAEMQQSIDAFKNLN